MILWVYRSWMALAWALAPAAVGAATFTVATYNLNNYLESPAGSRPVKSAASRAQIRECLRALRADILAVQEIGSPAALEELRQSLKAEGLDYPHWEQVPGFDTNIQVAVLSRFPIRARRSHTNEQFVLQGRRFRTSRGFAELEIGVNDRYRLVLLAAHLKSRRPTPEANEALLREQEALCLRAKVDARLAADPNVNLVLLGDFNDTKDSRTMKTLLGKGKTRLVDTRPAERNGDNTPAAAPYLAPSTITWTHFYGKEDTYSRVDYILLSSGLAREWRRTGTYVLAMPNWGLASDHRPILAEFTAEDK